MVVDKMLHMRHICFFDLLEMFCRKRTPEILLVGNMHACTLKVRNVILLGFDIFIAMDVLFLDFNAQGLNRRQFWQFNLG